MFSIPKEEKGLNMLGPVLFVEPCWLLENLLASPAV
jgi:hypothetical protein